MVAQATAVLIALGLASTALHAQAPVTFVPVTPGFVAATVPKGGPRWTGPGAAQQASTSAAGASEPNLEMSLALARDYLQQAVDGGDARYVGYAAAVLQPWSAARGPAELSLTRADIYARQHLFDKARAELDAVPAGSAKVPERLLRQALIAHATGAISEGHRHCRALHEIRPGLPSATCLGLSESLSGNARRGFARISRALAKRQRLDPSTYVWVLHAQAEIAARLGQAKTSAELLQQALAVAPGHDPALAALADVWLRLGKNQAVVHLLAPFRDRDRQLLRFVIARRRSAALSPTRFLRDLEDELEARLAASRRREEPQLAVEARYALSVTGDFQRAARLGLAAWNGERTVANAILATHAATANRQPVPPAVKQWLDATGLIDSRLASSRVPRG